MTRGWLVATSLLFAPSIPAFESELQAALHNQVTLQGYPEPQNYTLRFASLARREGKTERVGDQIVTTIDTRIDASLQPSYIHHEVAHACQIAMGGPSESVFMDEASATLQEMLAFKDSGAWKSSVAAFQSHPEISPFVDLGEGSKFEYGGALFLLFLEQRFGNTDGRLVLRLWVRAAAKLPNVDNAAWMRIIEDETGTDFTELVLAFAAFRLDHPGLRKFTVAGSHSHQIFITSDEWPWPLGCLFLSIPAALEPFALDVKIEKEHVSGIAYRKKGDHVEEGRFRLNGRSSITRFELRADQGLVLAICDLDKDAHLRRELGPRPLKIFFEY